MEADVRQQENTYRHEPAQESAYRPEPSRPAYAGDDRGAKTEAAAEERGGSREEKREEKRRGRFGKAEGKKDAKPAEGRDPSTAPRRAAPKPAPAGPSKGTRALTVVAGRGHRRVGGSHRVLRHAGRGVLGDHRQERGEFRQRSS